MFGFFAGALLALGSSTVPPAADAAGRVELGTTGRSVDAFADCFIASQEKAGTPFAYVLNGSDGGTFSTVPAAGDQSPYSLSVREEGKSRRIAITGDAPAPTLSAIRGCMA